jgi:hypothetical protein
MMHRGPDDTIFQKIVPIEVSKRQKKIIALATFQKKDKYWTKISRIKILMAAAYACNLANYEKENRK